MNAWSTAPTRRAGSAASVPSSPGHRTRTLYSVRSDVGRSDAAGTTPDRLRRALPLDPRRREDLGERRHPMIARVPAAHLGIELGLGHRETVRHDPRLELGGTGAPVAELPEPAVERDDDGDRA